MSQLPPYLPAVLLLLRSFEIDKKNEARPKINLRKYPVCKNRLLSGRLILECCKRNFPDHHWCDNKVKNTYRLHLKNIFVNPVPIQQWPRKANSVRHDRLTAGSLLNNWTTHLTKWMETVSLNIIYSRSSHSIN